MKQPRLGSDPLSAPTGVNALIRDTRSRIQSKQRLQSIHSTHRRPGARPRAPISDGRLPRTARPAPRGAAGAADRGLPPEWTRATFIVRKSFLEKLRDRATFRKNIKTILDDALRAHLRGGK